MMPRLVVAALFFAIASVSAIVLAHPAAAPPDYLRRLLHDCNDDWGGHSAVNDGHDIIALDVQEAYNATLGGDTLVLRFVMNGGYNSDSVKPELKEVLTFKAGTAAVTKEIRTSDNLKFTGTFDAVAGPKPFLDAQGSPDGARFYVNGVLRYSSLGLKVGDKLTQFNVQGYAGSDKADQMPGGYTTAGQTFADCSTVASEQGSGQASYQRSEYVLQGPAYYATLSLGASSLTSHPGGNETVLFTATNSLKEPQVFTLTASAPAGVRVIFHTDHYAEGSTQVAVAANAESVGHFYVVPSDNAQAGTLKTTMTSDLGARVEQQMPFMVKAATTSSSSASPTEASKGGGSPAPTAILLLMGVAAAAFLRRER